MKKNLEIGELFEAPFNLSGELIDNAVTAEGEARVRAVAESEARKAQYVFCLDHLNDCPHSEFGYEIGDAIRWEESDSRGLKCYRESVIVRVDRAKYSGAHTWYAVAGINYLVRDDEVRNSY